jgi:Holliday junction DNA helicase RuvA
VGPKLAQRIVLELKDKVGSLGGEELEITTTATVKGAKTLTAQGEAVEALISLGYTKGEASLAVSRLDENLSSEELIKQALKALARRF